jgi:hypothetical protein
MEDRQDDDGKLFPVIAGMLPLNGRKLLHNKKNFHFLTTKKKYFEQSRNVLWKGIKPERYVRKP